MATEYRYPNESSPTSSWLPTACPILDGSPRRPDRGIMRARATSGQPYSYQMANPTYFVSHRFKLSKAEYDDWDDFMDAVMGRDFRMRDDFIGEWITVRWWDESEWKPIRANNGAVDRVEGTITLLKVITP